MKKYKILRDFRGYQTGSGELQEFIAGDITIIHNHLAEVALKDGSIEMFLEEISEPKIIEIPANIREKKIKFPKEKK